MTLLLSVIAAALWCAEAGAKSVVRVPLGAQLTGLAVAPSGHVWASADAGGPGLWGPVTPDGRPRWRRYAIAHGFLGSLSARSDGGAWLVADRQTVLRLDPGGTAATFGSLAMPLADDSITEPWVLAVTASDDRLVFAGPPGRLLWLASDGTATAQELPVPAFDCGSAALTAAPDGTVVLADHRCSRLLRFSAAGEFSAVDVRSRMPWRRRMPGAVLAGRDGSLWFTALTLKELEIGTVLGRVAPNGAITQVAAPDAEFGMGGLAEAPDGTVWAPIRRACALYRVRGDRIERIPAPFRVHEIEFAPDGSAWLRGFSQLAHLSPAELDRSRPPRRCDTKAPRLGFPTAEKYTLSLRTLRRSGVRISSSEAGMLAGYVNVDDEQVWVHKVIRRAGGSATVRFPDTVLDHVAPRVRNGRRVELYFNPTLWDRAGNGIVRPGPFRLVP